MLPKASPYSEISAIHIKGLTKSFGNHRVLKGIDLVVGRGSFVTIFGPNGAGKTTLIKVLATLCKPSSGSVEINGLDLREEAVTIRRQIGVITHQTLLYDNLTAYENLKFYGKMYSVPHLEQRIGEVVEKVGLMARLHDRLGTLSRGMQQRLALARALIHNPPILLLDEPETGLDKQAAATLEEILCSGGEERTVVMTTHNLERGIGMGDQVVILADGRVVYQEFKRALDIAAFEGTYYHYTGARR